MKKLLIIIILSAVAKFATAQACPNAVISCPDTVNQAYDTCASYLPPGFTAVGWDIVFGPGTLSNAGSQNAGINGLQQGKTTVIRFTYKTPSGGQGYAITVKTWLPAACPAAPPQRTVSTVHGTVTLSDGSTYTF